MSQDPADDILEEIETPPPGPVAYGPAPLPAPAPAPAPRGHWVIVIPHPTMPSGRTLFEVALVVLLLVALIGPRLHLDGFRPLPPGPKVITGPLEARLIFDVERDGRTTERVREDATLALRLSALDCGWEHLQTTDPNAETFLAGHPAPAVAVYRRGTAQTVKVLERPQSGDEVVAAVKALRGKKD